MRGYDSPRGWAALLSLLVCAMVSLSEFERDSPRRRKWVIAQWGLIGAIFLVNLLDWAGLIDIFTSCVALTALVFAVFPVGILSMISIADEHGERLGLTGTGGFVVFRSLEGHTAGVRVRLHIPLWPGRGGGSMRQELEVEAAIPAPPSVRIAAEFVTAPDGSEPSFLHTRLDGIIREGGVHWRDLRRAEARPDWDEHWRFWESAPGDAATVFRRAQPPESRALLLTAVGVRDGVVRCIFAGSYVDRDEMSKAAEMTRDFADKLFFPRNAAPPNERRPTPGGGN